MIDKFAMHFIAKDTMLIREFTCPQLLKQFCAGRPYDRAHILYETTHKGHTEPVKEYKFMFDICDTRYYNAE